MTLQELFKAQGLTDEQITNITNAMKENKIYTANEENLDIRYGKLKTDFDSLTAQHGESTKLIEEMKKANKGNEELQGKITSYETQIATLQNQLKETQAEKDLQVALLGAKALDIDYLTYQVKKDGELQLDENGKIKGLDDKIAGLKTRFPNHFESASHKNIIENRIPNDPQQEPSMTKADILKKPYAERVKFAEENPEAYKEIMKN